MGFKKNIVRKNSYSDSVFLMQLAAAAEKLDGITAASLMMATPANKEILSASDLLTPDGLAAGNNDLIIALVAENEAAMNAALLHIEKLSVAGEKPGTCSEGAAPATLKAALELLPGANFALISVPGLYASREARKALENGLSVMVFSDNVSIEDEIDLKKTADARGLLLMGPDCGTAIINGVPLGFANSVPQGKIGIVAASGTGLQEVSVTIAKLGGGITHAIGTGGRDLSEEVGGITMLRALSLLADDPKTGVIVLISKPPHPEVARNILSRASSAGKPVVVCFLGTEPRLPENNLFFVRTLEAAASAAVQISEGRDVSFSRFTVPGVPDMIKKAAQMIGPGQKYIRGLFAGGTLCDEAIDVLAAGGLQVYSNAGPSNVKRLENLNKSSGHTLIDMGDDEFTRGRPHPMIDLSLRNKRILEEANDSETAVILFDLVLGYGAHPDPAGAMLDTLKEAGGSTVLAASVCGTDSDPQNYSRQVETLKDAGVFVLPSNAQAARFAAELVKAV